MACKFLKVIQQICCVQGCELRIRFFDSPTEAHVFFRAHEPSIPAQTTIQVSADEVHKPLAQILAAMNPEDRLEGALANAAGG